MRELEPSLGRFAFLTRWHSLHLPCRSWIGPFISPDSNHSSRNSTSKKTVSAALSHEHGGLASFSLRDRQAALHWLIRSGRFGWLPFRRHGTREGGREGGERRGWEGRGGEGRGGEGTVHTFHKPEPLWPRSLAGHPRSGWPASCKYYEGQLP